LVAPNPVPTDASSGDVSAKRPVSSTFADGTAGPAPSESLIPLRIPCTNSILENGE
jgi:hypothetical protein